MNEIWKVGQAYFIRTVTMHLVGSIVHVGNRELVLKDAAWVADSGRFMNALESGKLLEVEPFPDEVIVGRDSIVDATIWRHNLPLKQV